MLDPRIHSGFAIDMAEECVPAVCDKWKRSGEVLVAYSMQGGFVCVCVGGEGVVVCV